MNRLGYLAFRLILSASAVVAPGLSVCSHAGEAGVALAAQAQKDDDSGRSEVDVALQRRINLAISRGVKALLAEQEIDGSWRGHSSAYRNGQTSLSVYTLSKCDVEGKHPAIVRALEFLRAKPPSRTYSAACQLLALCTLDPEEHREWIAEIADDLVSWQRGGYGYPDGAVDLSNTQYAALGLRIAAQNGYRVPPRSWERLARWALNEQQSTPGAAGFRYRPNSEATGSMTAAGLAVLAIASEQLAGRQREYEQAIDRGRRWLDENIAVDRNPTMPFGSDQPTERNGGHHYYYLYGLERTGALLQTAFFGECDWYREGATWLVDRQDGKGRWGGQADTCFALLFLARATSKVSYTGEGIESATKTYGRDDPLEDVSLRAAGDRPLRIWISSLGDRAYEDFEWEGEEGKGLHVVRVEYRVEDPGAEEGSLLLSTVEGRPDQPVRGDRYPARLQIERSGRYRVFARVVIWQEGEGASEEERLFELESFALQVEISRGDDPRLDEYARDAARNLLNVPRLKVTASSQRNGGHQGSSAVDGRMGTMWLSAKDDPRPKLRLELPRPVRGNKILLTHASEWAGGSPPGDVTDSSSPARIRKVRVILNDSKEGHEVEMSANERVKTEVSLPRLTKIRSIDIEVLEVFPGGREDQGVGFAEVELVSERRR